MQFLYARRTGRTDAVRAAKTLIADDGALAQFPGPVALVTAEGAVVCANHEARRIAPLLADPAQELAAALADSLATGAARTVSPAEGEDGWTEIVILPLGKGTHALLLGRAAAGARMPAAKETGTRRGALRVVRAGDPGRAA